MRGILDGVKVIDLSRLLPGPFCTQMLADLGADVLKIEEIDGGDYARWMVPIGQVDGGQFLSINRNKRSMKLNLRSGEGKEILYSLIAGADVVVEQFRPGVMDRLGFGYETLKKVNPRIIMCSISGYGQEGPMSQAAGHDINYLSLTGILDMIGTSNGDLAIPAIQIADVGGGAQWAAFGIMAALYAREKTGQGQYIDISMTDAVFTYMCAIAGAYSTDHIVQRRATGQLFGGYAWYYIYKTKDNREISLGMLEGKFWKDFCNAIGRPEYVKMQMGPNDVQEKMKQELAELFLTKTADEWMEFLGPLDACAAKVNNIEEALADEHLKARGMIVELDHPVEGKVNVIGFPVKFSEQPWSLRMVPPTFGQHTDDVLKDLGYSTATIVELHDKGIV